jgi:Transcriptional regulators
MAKLFYTNIPSEEELSRSASTFPEADKSTLFTHLLLRRVSTDLEINLDALFSQYNLSTGRFTLMNLLRENTQGLMPSEISQRVGVTQATISGLISSLEKAELVHRETHEKDGRAYVIKLTQQGTDLIKKIIPEYFGRIETFWSNFSQDEKKEMNEYFDRMLKNINALGATIKQ